MFSLVLFVVLWMASGIPGLMLMNLYRAKVEKQKDVSLFDDDGLLGPVLFLGPVFTCVVSGYMFWLYVSQHMKMPKWLKKINFKLS